jgi:hypothetical protein
MRGSSPVDLGRPGGDAPNNGAGRWGGRIAAWAGAIRRSVAGRLAVRGLLLGLLAYAVPAAYIELCPMNFQNNNYPLYRWKQDAAAAPSAVPDDVVVLGDSRALTALVPSLLSDRALSLAVTGGTAIEAYYGMRRYLEHHPAPPRVLVSISPAFLQDCVIFWASNVRFKYLTVAEHLEVLQRSERLGWRIKRGGSDFHGPLHYYGTYALYRLNVAPFYRAELTNARLVLRRGENLRRYDDIARARGHVFFNTGEVAEGLMEETKAEAFRPSPLLDAYLSDLLTMCARRGSRAVFLTVPFSAPSLAAMKPGFLDQYREYLVRLGADHPDAAVETTVERWPFDFFADQTHLNEKGAVRYSAAIRAQYLGGDTPATR